MEVRTGRDEQTVALCEVAVLGLARGILVAAVSLQRAKASVGQASHKIAQRLPLKLEGVGVSERDQCASRHRLFDRGLWINLAASHVGVAASTDQTLEGVATICAVAGGDQCVGHVRPTKIASGSCPHVLPRNLKSLFVETAHHLFGAVFAVDLPRSGPGTERLWYWAREPGQQMTLACAVLCRQFDARHNVNAVLDTCRLRLGDSLKRVVIGQSQHLDSTLGSKLDDVARSMATVR